MADAEDIAPNSKHTHTRRRRRGHEAAIPDRTGPSDSNSYLPGTHTGHTKHRDAGRYTEDLLNKTKPISEEVYNEWIVPDTKYRCLYNLRRAAIDLIKVQQDAELAYHHYRKAKREAEAEQVKKAQKAKDRASDERRSALSRVDSAKEEILRASKSGFGAGGSGTDKSEGLIMQFAEDTALALSQSVTIGDAIMVLSALNKVVELTGVLGRTYSSGDILYLKREYERLAKEHRKLQESSGAFDAIYEQVEKLYELAKRIKSQELEDSRMRISRYNTIAATDVEMREMQKIKKNPDA